MKILIADDHPLIRDSLIQVAGELDRVSGITQAACAEEVLSALADDPDIKLVLLDLVMPGSHGFDLLVQVCRDYPGAKTVVLSASESGQDMRQSLDAGASGFIPKSSRRPILLSALRLVLDGGIYVPPELLGSDGAAGNVSAAGKSATPDTPLTPRQQEVLALLSRGHSNKAIARTLELSEHTVKIHVASILRALGVSNRTQAAMQARIKGLVEEG